MRVADRRELVCVRGIRVLVEPRENLRVAVVAEAVELFAQQARPCRVGGLGLEGAQRLEVEVEAPCLRVEQREDAAPQLGDGTRLTEHAVARKLDLELERARLRAGGDHGIRPLAATAGVEALHHAPVLPQRRLAPRDEEQIDARAAPGIRHGRAHTQPERRPERPETLADLDGAVVEPLRLAPGDPIDRAGDEQLVDAAHVGVDALPQPAGRLREPRPRVLELADQAARVISLHFRMPGGSIPERASLVSTAEPRGPGAPASNLGAGETFG